MTRPEPGDLFLVPFPFTDLKTTKRRPALILEFLTLRSMPALAIVAMLTSQIDSEKITGDLLVKDWKEIGLLHPSKIRLAKVVTLEEELLIKRLGCLTKRDRDDVKREFRNLFFSWIS